MPADDFAGDASTLGLLPAEGSVAGTLEAASDSDWFAVSLQAGSFYIFDLVPDGSRPLEDPFLRLRDADGMLLGGDDDSGDGLASRMQYLATETGTYFIDVQSWDAGSAGSYPLSVLEPEVSLGTGGPDSLAGTDAPDRLVGLGATTPWPAVPATTRCRATACPPMPTCSSTPAPATATTCCWTSTRTTASTCRWQGPPCSVPSRTSPPAA